MDSLREHLAPHSGLRFSEKQPQASPVEVRVPEYILDRLQNPVVSLDAEHHITYCNRAAEQLYGFTFEEVRGVSFGEATRCNWPPATWENGGFDPPDDGARYVRITQHTRRGRRIQIEASVIASDDVTSANRFTLILHRKVNQNELAAALREREHFDALLSDLSTQFSGLPEDDVDQAIQEGLLRLVDFLDVDRSSLSQLTADNRFLITHSLAVGGTKPCPLGVGDNHLPWLVEELRARRTVVLRRIPDDLPPNATVDRETLARDGAKGAIAIPLHVENSLVCVLTFGSYRTCRDWPDELLQRLGVAGEIFANAVARRQAKDRLQRKQQELEHLGRVAAMSELASVIAHELDQPLTAIMSNAQATRHLLARAEPDIAESYAALDDIIADTLRASEIVQRERRLLRKGRGNIEPLDLNQIARDAELFISADARQQGCRTMFELSADLLRILGDRIQLQQVLLNLARNAIQTMSEQPREQRVLGIRTSGGVEEVLLEVKDAGPPIDNSHLDRMFEPFFTTKSGGLGMGLSISRSIVQAHHGRIWAIRNPGRGLTLHVAIPREAEVQHDAR